MEQQTALVMKQTLQPQTAVKKMHMVIASIDSGENPDYEEWLINTIDIADVTTNIDDYTSGDPKVIDYDGYYRAVYNEVKQFIQNRLNYAVDQWKGINQTIIQP